jgi:hypothetical protein
MESAHPVACAADYPRDRLCVGVDVDREVVPVVLAVEEHRLIVAAAAVLDDGEAPCSFREL